MSGARLFAILLAFTAVMATALTIVISSSAVIPSDPGASAVSTLDRILGVEEVNRPKLSRAERARRARRPRTHRVKENETPTIIAAKYGLRPSELRQLNRGVDVLNLQKGQLLRLR